MTTRSYGFIMSRFWFLYNPMAGNGCALERAKKLSEKYPESKVCDMTAIGGYKELFEQIPNEDSVVICGGDGTLNRFANDIAELDMKNKIYYSPVGTGNDFFRDLPEPKDENDMYEVSKYIRGLPSVEVKGRTSLFINGIGYGVDGYCCEEGDRQRAQGIKKVDYTAIAIKGILSKFKRVNATVTVDGEKKEYKKVWLAPTMNGRYYGGGIMPTPNQDRLSDDGKLSLMVFHGSGKLKTLIVFPSIFKGEHVKHTKIIDVLTGYDITVEFDRPTALQIDGETVTEVTSYRARSRNAK